MLTGASVPGRCRNGHELTPETIYRRTDGAARCRLCERERARRRGSIPSKSKPPLRCACGATKPQPKGTAQRKTAWRCRSCVEASKRAPSWRIYPRACESCSQPFIGRQSRSVRCKPCRQRHGAENVMGFYRLAISNFEIPKAVTWRRKLTEHLAARDGARCGICREKIDLTLPSGPRGDDRGPSIDHVVPRSQGGTDDLINLRLTHWRCNRERKNRGGNEQLRLVS